MIGSKAIDDTTLRDGVQMPGIRAPSPEERLRIAHYLDEIGVSRIEIFGTWYDIDRQTANLILNAGLNCRVGVWVRANTSDIDDALKLNEIKEVGISHPISDIHLKYKLNISQEQAFERITKAVQYAIDHGLKVFYHGEDCTRADWEFEKNLVKTLAELGVETYRICDTVGVGIPTHVSPDIPINKSIPDKVRYLSNYGIDIEAHFHDDLGNAVTNTLVALQNGAKWASTTLLGMGERSGNAETEKVIMNLVYHYGAQSYNTKILTKACRYISKTMDIRIPTNKALVGINSFTHQSGIHTDGVIKHPETYEFIDPAVVGNRRRLLVGPYSGKKIIYFKIKQYVAGITEDDSRVKAIVDYLQNNLFGTGIRRSPLTEEEFTDILRRFGFSF
ncbi:MAG: LeuA family protein [Candidatus Helarchaeota archaeon]